MRQGLLLLLPLLMTACAEAQRPDATAALQEAVMTQQASLAAVGAPAATQGPGLDAGLAMPVAASAAALGAAPHRAGSLVGQTPEALRLWFGEPRLRRVEGAAEVWHYQASQCHLDLVLYPDEGGRQTLRVAHAAARAAGAARRGEAACLSDIARGAARPAGSVAPERASAGI